MIEMGVVISFDYNGWSALFPQFNYLTQQQVTLFFNLATQFVRNDGCGPVCSVQSQTNLLWLATAHIAQLIGPQPPTTIGGGTTGPNATMVGRISNATEGSVSVGTENNYPPGSAQFWQQTQYGSMFWLASAPYRTARYMPGWVRNMDPYAPPFLVAGQAQTGAQLTMGVSNAAWMNGGCNYCSW